MELSPADSRRVRPRRHPGPIDFDAGRMALLEQIAGGAPLRQVLESIIDLVQRQKAGARCTILLLNAEQGRVWHGAAPSMPKAYVDAINGQPIGPAAGSCGAAAFLGKRVIVEDIASHPNWVAYRALALHYGLRACWSSPIFSTKHQVLGTFAIYYNVPRGPSPEELAWVDGATSLTAIAIGREQREKTIVAQAALLDKANDAIVVRSLDGIVRYWNEGATRIYGWTAQDAVGKSCSDLMELDLKAEAEAKQTLVETGSFSGELNRVNKAGCALIVDSSWTLLRDETDTPSAVLVISSDITLKKQLEAQVVHAQRMESLATLAGGIAHEFNNILTTIMGNVGLAKRQLPKEHALVKKLDLIGAASRRAATLVHQIMIFSQRREAPRQSLHLKPIVEDAVQLLQASVPAMIEIQTSFDETEALILANARQMHQLVMNLATNAVAAIASHGLLAIRLEAVSLATDLTGLAGRVRAGPCLRLSVEDNGRGMDEATLARVFEPFFTTQKGAGCAGLGLAVVHGIVKEHEAALIVRSKVDQGTTVEVYLPLAEASAVEAVPSADDQAAVAPGKGERILCVDDEASVLNLLLDQLRGAGYHPEGFTDPTLALAAWQKRPAQFDALVTDFAMHGMTGTELTRAIRQDRAELPVIMTSGYLRPAEQAEARAAGVAVFLTKPEFLEQLARVLAEVLPR